MRPERTNSVMDNFALSDDHMFLNTLVHRIAKEKEVRFIMIDKTVREGFITGLDEEWIQITTTQGQTLVLINIVNISILEETGENLRDIVIHPDERENTAQKDLIRAYCSTIWNKAKKVFQEKQAIKASRINRNEDRDLEDATPLRSVFPL